VCFIGYGSEKKGIQKMAAKKAESDSSSIGRLELLSSFKGKITDLVDFGDTPLGKRYDVYFEGDLTGGKISGKMRGVDYILVRSDEVSELNVKAAITTDDDVNLSVEISGYMQNNEIRDHSLKVITGHEKYKWLTSKIIVGRGKLTSEGLEINYFVEP
jgi:Protein of unknown function (DUF3237).